MTTRLTSLSENIIQFCRFLRLRGFSTGVEEEVLTLQAMQHIDYTSNKLFFLTLKAVLCRNKTQSDEFDDLFHVYWRQLDKAVNAKDKEEPVNDKPPASSQAQFKALKTWLHGNKNDDTEETATYSIEEGLSQKDFSSVPDDEIEELMQHIKALSKRLAAKVNRRYEFSRKTDLPDLRRTLRKNLRRGGELLDIINRKPKHNRIKLLVLCDVSKSMELYTAFLIQFLYAFQQVYTRMETFVFSTSLHRITSQLKQKNFDSMLNNLDSEKNDWNSGTRIGESLNEFVNKFGQQLLTSKTIVIILSDGWDAGNMELLEKNMEIISSKSKKIIWLNPLAGYEAYRPDVAGMRTALPYIDVFAPVHNAESLRKLGKWL
ncbi:MAG: VWA domain-containing protein [Bacteroidota bacterium]